MKRNWFIVSAFTIGLSLIAVSLWAGDFSRYSTEELMDMHEGIHRMGPEEQRSFQEEMHSRYPSMTPDQRRQFRGYMHDGGPGEWNDHHNGDYHYDRNGHMDGGSWNDMGQGRGGTGRSSGHHH